jgi:hypothetical protein
MPITSLFRRPKFCKQGAAPREHARLTGKRKKWGKLFVERLEDRMLPSTFTVITADDSGPGSLRAAVVAANSQHGTDEIRFHIMGNGVHTIQLQSALPVITDTVIIDGGTQPGYIGKPLVALDGGQSVDPDGMIIMTNDSTVRGLAIDNFFGIGIHIAGGDHNLVEDNFIGADPTGNAPMSNLAGIVVEGRVNRVASNLISGNRAVGVFLAGDQNTVVGNKVGTDWTGSRALANRTGICVQGQSNWIGSEGDENVSHYGRNLISGNLSSGVLIASGSDNGVAGNYIGTDSSGTAILGNEVGVWVLGQSNWIGAKGSETAGNVISGNHFDGVRLSGDENTAAGNRIGTDAGGRIPLGNNVGIFVEGQASRIGTNDQVVQDEAHRNVISGNATAGLLVSPDLRATTDRSTAVAGNFIGTDATGRQALGNTGVGVGLDGGPSKLIGNLVSANGEGVLIGSDNNEVTQNLIGTDITGARPLGNGSSVSPGREAQFREIAVTSTRPVLVGGRIQLMVVELRTFKSVAIARDPPDLSPIGNGITVNGMGNVIGGTATSANTIAFNRGAGVVVLTPFDGPAAVRSSGGQVLPGNSIRANSIFANGALGIDLQGDGVTFNDVGDADFLQNFPVLAAVRGWGGHTEVIGSLDSLPDTTFTLDFYASAAADASGFGEGQRYLGSATVTTDDSGNAGFDVTLDTKTTPNEVISATATNPDGATSEYSFVLEGRANAQVRDGQLVIQGQAAGIRIAAGPSGSFQVTEGNRTESFTGIVRGIRISLEGGNGAVFVDGSLDPLTIPGGIELHAKGGSAGVAMSQVIVQGPALFDLGSGHSLLAVNNASFDADLSVLTGGGGSMIRFQNTTVAGNFDLGTGSATDVVVFVNSTFGGSAVMDTSAGDDLVIVENTNFSNSASINTGDGNDRVFLLSMMVQGPIQLIGGLGDDFLFTADLNASLQQVLSFETIQMF